MVKKLNIINSKGGRLSLNDSTKHFYTEEPNGIGFSRDLGLIRLGRMWQNTIDQYELSSLTLAITCPTFEGYTELRNFARGELTIELEKAGKTYLADCLINSWAYLEYNEPTGEWIKVQLVLDLLSPWYVLETYQLPKNQEATGGKTYNHGYSYTYSMGEIGALKINNYLALDNYTKLIIYGAVTNPRWRVYDTNAKLISDGKINVTIPTGSKLVINSQPTKLSINEMTSDNTVIRSCYQFSDFSTDRFFTLGANENKIVVDHEGTNKLNYIVEVMFLYGTV